MAKARRPPAGLVPSAVAWGVVCIGVVVLVQSDRGAALPGERKVIAESRFSVTEASAQTKLVQLVVDFEPGHGHCSTRMAVRRSISCSKGRLRCARTAWSFRIGRVSLGPTAARKFTPPATPVPAKARLLTNFLLPAGAPEITVIEESRFGPSIMYEAKFDLPALPAEADIVQQVIDLAPGWRAEGDYNGFIATIVIEGDVTYQIDGERKQYRAGDAFSVQARARVTEYNLSNRSSRVFASYLVPRAARLNPLGRGMR